MFGQISQKNSNDDDILLNTIILRGLPLLFQELFFLNMESNPESLVFGASLLITAFIFKYQDRLKSILFVL